MRHYVCSVENGHRVPHDIRRILVPVDFSESSIGALVYAIGLAEPHGAQIDVLHVIDLPPYPAMGTWNDNDGSEATTMEQHLHELAGERMRELAARAEREGMHVNTIIDDGEAVPVIARRAAEYDLVVIGAHEDDSLSGLFLGNVTDRLAGELKVPLVAVRAEDRPAPRASVG